MRFDSLNLGLVQKQIKFGFRGTLNLTPARSHRIAPASRASRSSLPAKTAFPQIAASRFVGFFETSSVDKEACRPFSRGFGSPKVRGPRSGPQYRSVPLERPICDPEYFAGKEEGKRSATPLWLARRRVPAQSKRRCRCALPRSAGALQRSRVSPILRTPL
jgi:hypothetical protein